MTRIKNTHTYRYTHTQIYNIVVNASRISSKYLIKIMKMKEEEKAEKKYYYRQFNQK